MHRPPAHFCRDRAAVVAVACSLWRRASQLAVGGSLYYVLGGHRTARFRNSSLARQRKLGSHIFGALLAVTLAWSLFEVGTDPWALAPRCGCWRYSAPGC